MIAVALLLAAAPPAKLTILWPRVIPSAQAEATAELARAAQQKVSEAARRAMPGREHELRPKGERSCPDAGCPGGSVGVLLLREGSGCAAVALVGVPGRSRIRLAAWAGTLELKKYEVEFREPPESSVRIKDYVACTDLVAKLSEPSVDVDRAIVDMLAR